MGFLARIVGGGAVLHVSNFFNCLIVFKTANKTPAFSIQICIWHTVEAIAFVYRQFARRQNKEGKTLQLI